MKYFQGCGLGTMLERNYKEVISAFLIMTAACLAVVIPIILLDDKL